jgi:hypothetical protein
MLGMLVTSTVYAGQDYHININTPISTTGLTVNLSGTANAHYVGQSTSQKVTITSWGDGSPATDAATSFTFNYGAKTFSGTWSASHTYTTGGNYTVTAKVHHGNVSGAEGSDVATDTEVVIILQPVNGGWSAWSTQPTACGLSGTLTRTCTNPAPANGGAACVGPSTQSYTNDPCPVNGTWSAWTPATSECGTGTFTQTRTCEGALYGGTCLPDADGTLTSKQVARTACPINGGWSAWDTQPTGCGLSGTLYRTCTSPAPQFGGADCSQLDGGNNSKTYQNPACQYTLTYTAGSNGTISGTSPQTVTSGQDGTTVTAVPDTHFHFNKWSDDLMTAIRKDTNVLSNISVVASFLVNPQYTLTYVAGANGSLTGNQSQIIWEGENGTEVTAVPNSDSSFTGWDDGVTTPARTDIGVTATKTITANFSKLSDVDQDGIPDVQDNCPNTANSNQADSDNDKVGDACDNCVNVSNADQTDSNADGIGDACAPLDTDQDTIPDATDNCVYTPNTNQQDDDGDGIGNACDQYNCRPTNDGVEIYDTLDNDCDGYYDEGFTKVDGGWSDWSTKSTQCGYRGEQTRSCNNPAPANGGANCEGSSTREYANDACTPNEIICDDGQELVNNECVNIVKEEPTVTKSRSKTKWGSRIFDPSSRGQVLGAETSCGIYVDKFLKKGLKGNDTEAVKKVQTFLNTYMASNLTVDGKMGTQTDAALKAFQAKHADKVLAPWGLVKPTGIFYLTSQTEVNNIMCPALGLPIPELVPTAENPLFPKA